MYEALLQSADRPFRATPDTKFYFPSDSIEQARQTIVRAILRAEGPCLVLGGAGLGKTMLGQIVADDVYGRFDIVKLHATGLCSRRALLQSILFELRLPYRELSEGELRMSIMDRLSPSPETAPSGILMIVDEAHTLSPKLLEELRLITNFARNGQPRARLVLMGNMRLEDTFANPQLDSFNQRLAARCYLQPMTRDQSMEFVRHQLRCAQVEPATLITNDALRTLYAASEGVPRLLNQVMDHALVLGISSGQCPISASLIEEAWSDLQQLPAPWHSSNAPEKAAAGVSTSTIEFGELSDDDEESFVESTTVSSSSARASAKTPAKRDESSLSINTISIATARYAYPTVEGDQDTDSNSSADEYALADESTGDLAEKLASDLESLDVIKNAPKQNFFAAFEPIAALDSNLLDADQEATDDDLAIAQEGQLVSEIKRTPVKAAAERVVFDASKAFGLNRHQSKYPRGTDSVSPVGSIVEPFSMPVASASPSGKSVAKDSLTLADEIGLSADYGYAVAAGPSSASLLGSHTSDMDILDFEKATDEIIASSESVESVWENDPPIHETQPKVRPNAKQSMGRDAVHGPDQFASDSAGNLFGEDFEEEISIASKGGLRKDRRIFEPKPLGVVADLPLSARHAAAEEQVTAMESQRLELDEVGTYEDATLAKKYAASGVSTEKRSGLSPESILASWTVDVAATEAEREIALHTEIEDLVSQLNFSAFAVEPFSVEQIAIDYQRDAGVSKQRQANHANSEGRETIYTLHTNDSAEMDEDIHSNLTMDDDRDLLIIEEELPVSNRMVAEQLEAPIVKAPNYSQLFAKLRH